MVLTFEGAIHCSFVVPQLTVLSGTGCVLYSGMCGDVGSYSSCLIGCVYAAC